MASRKGDPCVGRAAPVEITSASAEKLEFIIKFSTALQGCKDSSTLSLAREADGKRRARLPRPDDDRIEPFRH